MTGLDSDDPNATFSSDYLSTETMFIAMDTIRSSHTTSTEHSIGSITCCKLQKLDTWPDWKKCELSQLNKMNRLGMCSRPCKRPCNATVLCSHW